MFQTLKNAWKIPELRNKILVTLLIIVIYRLGASIPVPFVSANALETFNSYTAGSIFQYMNLLSGDAFGKATVFALAVSPYITASIVMQLLTIAIPPLERLAKNGEEGRKKISAITRWVTVVLALVTAIGYTRLMFSYNMLVDAAANDEGKLRFFPAVVMIACYCAGAALIMWLAEKINDKGVGNGISIILFANIVSGIPSYLYSLYSFVVNFQYLWLGIILGILIFAVVIAVIVLIVWFTESERQIKVMYAKRVVGRKMYGGQTSSLPLKMNMAGVMPIIFASSIVSIPSTIASFITNQDNWFYKFATNYFNYNKPLYIILYLGLIIAFSYFYIMISFNPVEVANNIRSQGGSIPGIRPGRPTSDYITKILNRVTFIGAIFLIVVSGIPLIANAVSGGTLSALAFSGSSLMIIVGVALEVVRDIESQMTLRNYKGFLD